MSDEILQLAQRRAINLKVGGSVETPILLPSFSSKAIQGEQVQNLIIYMKSVITDHLLISAYDLFYREIKKKITFPSLIFLDSGGYEASEDVDLSDMGRGWPNPRKWTREMHSEVLKKWDHVTPTILVSFDSPNARTSIENQVVRATRLFRQYPMANSELLLKPTKRSTKREKKKLEIDQVLRRKHLLAGFDIIGVTEKELGRSTLERMTNVARLRLALNSIGLDTPIHIFGSLDTVSTPLYFLAGADIFDGLTWLRYAFDDGNTTYKNNYGAKNLGIAFEDFKVNGKVWNDNYYYLNRLKEDMAGYLSNRDFNSFRANADFYRTSLNLLAGRLKQELKPNGG